MPALPPPPPGVDLGDDRRASVIAASVITWALAVLAVALRLISRQMREVGFWIDDWLVVAALFPASAHVFAIAGYAMSRGYARHIWVGPPDAFYAWALSLFIAEIGYTLTLVLVKWSILAFYWRSFHVRLSVQIPILILASIVLMWGMAVFLITIFQCQPTNAWWERFNPDHPLDPSQFKCTIDQINFFLGNAIPTIVTDILMLIFPLPYIYMLQLPRGQKIALTGVFTIGLFLTIVSCMRLRILLTMDLVSPDITWNANHAAVWSIVECNIAIVCASLPFLRPILSKITFGVLSLSSHPSRKPSESSDTAQKPDINQKDKTVRGWEGDGRFGASSAHVRAFSASSITNEHPFVQLDDVSEQSLPVQKKDVLSNIELKDIPTNESGRTSPLTDGIVITREIRMQHQSAV